MCYACASSKVCHSRASSKVQLQPQNGVISSSSSCKTQRSNSSKSILPPGGGRALVEGLGKCQLPGLGANFCAEGSVSVCVTSNCSHAWCLKPLVILLRICHTISTSEIQRSLHHALSNARCQGVNDVVAFLLSSEVSFCIASMLPWQA